MRLFETRRERQQRTGKQTVRYAVRVDFDNSDSVEDYDHSTTYYGPFLHYWEAESYADRTTKLPGSEFCLSADVLTVDDILEAPDYDMLIEEEMSLEEEKI